MGSPNSFDITVPTGCDVRLSIVSPYCFVLVAPPGVKADLDMFRHSGITGLFTHDPGVNWPDTSGCRAASFYLANDVPICLQFDALGGAMACRKRLLAETVQ